MNGLQRCAMARMEQVLDIVIPSEAIHQACLIAEHTALHVDGDEAASDTDRQGLEVLSHVKNLSLVKHVM